MSAFMVSDDHINLLVSASFETAEDGRPPRGGCGMSFSNGGGAGPMSPWRADDVGRMLVDANVRALEAAYGPADRAGWRFDPSGWTARRTTSVQILKAIECFVYQCAVAGAGWRGSAAEEYCDRLQKHVISRLPGYDAAEWGSGEAVWRGDGGGLRAAA